MGAAVLASRGFGEGRPSFRANLDVLRTVFWARIKIISRYKGAIFMEALLPIVFAALPVLLGVSVATQAGNDPGAAFAENTMTANAPGTTNFKLYMLLGAATFMVVTLMLWLVGYWVRREQETGTLEAVYLSPVRRFWVIAGVASYAFVRALIAFVIALTLGGLVFGVNPFQGGVGLALVFLALGMLPLWGIAFMFGAFILKIKEADSVINILQWVVSFFMGVFFPILLFPELLQFVAISFPPTVMTDGMRAAILGIGYFFGQWYWNMAVLAAMALILPLLGYEVFITTERRLKRKEGVGQY